MEEVTPARPIVAKAQRLSATFEVLHGRYARVFWTLHSIWALTQGIAVLVLAHNRYGFLPWVVLFLALTWGTTLFFSRIVADSASRAMRIAQGFVSYITRVMYQETLFFLIPFYVYSTTFPSWNSAYVVLLALLAVFSCYDLAFDRLLRTSRGFALAFFAFVSFSALQFFLPVFLKLPVHRASILAAALAFGGALLVAFPTRELLQVRLLATAVLGALAIMGAVWLLRPAVPPVPLRLTKLKFASSFDPKTMRVGAELAGAASRSQLAGGRLYAVATVFAPTELPSRLALHFYRDGKRLRSSRTVEMYAHPRGFRIWDVLREPPGGFAPGMYRVELKTAEGQLVGRGSLLLH